LKKIDIFCYSSLSQVGIKQGMTGSERNDEGVQYTRLNVYVTLRRRANFYYFNICFPMFLLGFISFVTFFLEPTDLNSRMCDNDPCRKPMG